MAKVLLKIGSYFDAEMGYDEIIYPAHVLVPDTHQYLLDFVGADLSCLESAAADCLSRMDFAHPSQSPKIEKAVLSNLISCFESLHPIYKRTESAAHVEVNRAFIQRAAYRLSRECEEPLDKERFIALIKTACDERYINEDWIEEFLEYATQQRVATDFQINGTIFHELSQTQHEMKLLVYLVFDCSNQQFASVPVEKRAAVYCGLFHGEYLPLLTISSELNISAPADIKNRIARIEFAGLGDPDEDFYRRLGNLANGEDSLPPDALMEMMDAAKKDDEDLVVETYETMDLRKLFSYEIMMMIKDQVRVKRCKNCQGYFVIDKPKVEYCNRIVAGETKPCNEIGKARVYQKKIEADAPTLCYRKAYKTHYARIKAGRLSKGEFSTWAAEASDKLAQVKNGQLAQDDFKAWLSQPK